MLQSFASSSSLTEDSQADRHLMLRAIGINPDGTTQEQLEKQRNEDYLEVVGKIKEKARRIRTLAWSAEFEDSISWISLSRSRR